MSTIDVTFTWGAECGEPREPLTLSFQEASLNARDPEGTSLMAAKMRFAKSKQFEMSPRGPGEDEYMCVSMVSPCRPSPVVTCAPCLCRARSPAVVKFVASYIETESLEVPPEIEADDAERALEFFGFSELEVVVPESDPNYVGKALAYNVYRSAIEAVPKVTKWLKERLLSGKVSGAGVHFIVDNNAGTTMNQFAESVDVLVRNYHPSDLPIGASVMRIGGYSGITYPESFRLLGTDDKISSALRSKVLAEVKAFGGLTASWTSVRVAVADTGEYGQISLERETRYVLKVAIDGQRVKISTEGIKRARVE